MSHHSGCGHCSSSTGCSTQETQEAQETRTEVSYVLHKLITKACSNYLGPMTIVQFL